MRSIGETFKTNPVTGTASAQIPLPLTPSPRGSAPALSLSYDSGQGNGVFGLGWGVSVPQIVRKTDKRLPEYLDAEDSDVFVFGGEDLVPSLTGPQGTRETRTVVEGLTSYVVDRFRPRTEGAFSIIERWTDTELRSSHFRVRSADNATSVFGKTTDGRICDPARPLRAYAWLLERTEDDRGNIVHYQYKRENFAGVSFGTVSESHRKGQTTLAQLHLKRVLYANTSTDGGGCKLELVFDYGEHQVAAPAPGDDNGWSLRPDPFSTYRAGFEIRSYRLCRRVLMFHHFEELHAQPTLVRSLELTYTDANPKVMQIASAKLVGYDRNGSTYIRQELPSVQFAYTASTFTTKIHPLPEDDARDFNPQALTRFAQWVDLDGEGLPGVLTDRGGALSYKDNLGAGRLGDARPLPSAPNLSLQGRGAAQLMDIDGSGAMSVVTLDATTSGYFKREGDGWAPFRTFSSNPSVSWSDPNLRMVDLNGDGFDDILIARGDHFVWYPSLGRDGFGQPERVPIPDDETQGPTVVFANRDSSVFLADMTGDGLADLVRVKHSEVVYWPNLGHGTFGAQVAMSQCPTIEDRPHFHAARARLADLDGTGTADLLYFDGDGMHIWPNHCGNSFGAKQTNPSVPVPECLGTLAIIDLLGTGTSTVTWASRRTNEPLLYTSPFGTEKPYLLAEMKNGMGLDVAFTYAPSTKFYLADRRARRPWATKLPFPVHVVESVRSEDHVSRTRLVTSYRYRHGFYDAHEREFRGFGMVEQVDAETFNPGDNQLDQAPVLTRTWFHTGAWVEGNPLEAAFASERWTGDGAAPAPIACVLPTELSPEATVAVPPWVGIRESNRALKGTMLRQEIYAQDDSAVPYAVTESSYEVKELQPPQPAKGTNRPRLNGVFQLLARESRSFTYDRVADDPRVTQWVALHHDEYGFVTEQASVAYARRAIPSDDPALVDLGATPLAEQARVHAIVTESDLGHALAATHQGYRLAVPRESRTYELTGLPQSSAPLDLATLKSTYAAAKATTRDYHEPLPADVLGRRLVERIKIRYYDTSAASLSPRPFPEVDARAIPYESYQLDLTDGVLGQVFSSQEITADTLQQAGYVTLPGEPGCWWRPSGRSLPDTAHYYLPTEIRDPFGNITKLSYDEPHYLFVTEVEDAAQNIVTSEIDYRVFAPKLVTDPNGNRVEARFDPMGRVTATAVKGKTTESLGDDLDNPTQEFLYVTDRWSGLTPEPNYVRARTRKEHGGTADWQESYVYSDGSGRIAMTKIQAEPGDEEPANPRWVGSGRTVLNNKGNPVKQYEPYFSGTHEYEDEDDLVQWGITPILQYDPIGRVIRIDLPDGTYTTTQYSVWKTIVHDANDSIIGSAWEAEREPLPSSDPKKRALVQARLHANTPSRTYIDPLGRPFLAVAHNKVGAADQFIATRTELDIEGQAKTVTDPLGRTCETHVYSIAGQLLHESNIDKGTRRTIADVLGGLLRRIDDRAQTFRAEHDALRRATHLWLQTGTAAEVLLERRYYGEAAADPPVNNLRGKPIAVYDGAGLLTTTEYDFKGNLVTSARKLTTAYDALIDWSDDLALVQDPAAAELAVAERLQTDPPFTERRQYDALNRIKSAVSPDGSIFTPTYNQAGLLERVDVNVRGASAATNFVHGIDYDAKGQRLQIQYSQSGTASQFLTTYQYDDKTFRLKKLVSTRLSDSKTLQDLAYTYDPVGNIVQITDDAQQDTFFNTPIDVPANKYTYDAVYRLIQANGREHQSNGVVQLDNNDCPIRPLRDPNDPTAVREYSESYQYDPIGNITQLFHNAGAGAATWTRAYSYPAPNEPQSSNRLMSVSGGGNFSHDAHGNITAMPHLAAIDYSPFDQMSHADLGGGGDAYYIYGADGQRLRKVHQHASTLIEERIYLGGYEIYRKRDQTGLLVERETLHVMDGVSRIAMVETKTVDAGAPPFTPTPRVRFQLGNHLGSALLEVDEAGLVISYEEYLPYGASAYRSARGGVEVSARRYRYTGKERDEESGLYYHGARYYACWLARWTSADPLGIGADGPGLYSYVRGSPVGLSDPSGMDALSLATGLATRTNLQAGAAFAAQGEQEKASHDAKQAADDELKAETKAVGDEAFRTLLESIDTIAEDRGPESTTPEYLGPVHLWPLDWSDPAVELEASKLAEERDSLGDQGQVFLRARNSQMYGVSLYPRELGPGEYEFMAGTAFGPKLQGFRSRGPVGTMGRSGGATGGSGAGAGPSPGGRGAAPPPTGPGGGGAKPPPAGARGGAAGPPELVSRIKESPKLVREAEAAGKSHQGSIDKLTKQLGAGNLDPGIGTRPIGHGISEARGRAGGRVYFRQRRDGTIEILGKSDKGNQDAVLDEVLRVFGR